MTLLGRLAYCSNNSGGDWWLSDDNWAALEDAGWTVHWETHDSRIGSIYDYDTMLVSEPRPTDFKTAYRWLGGLARSAAKAFNDPAEGVREWERLTNQDAGALGCNCCRPPHDFTFYRSAKDHTWLDISAPESVAWSWG